MLNSVIVALKFADPSPVVSLLHLLGAVEIVTAIMFLLKDLGLLAAAVNAIALAPARQSMRAARQPVPVEAA